MLEHNILINLKLRLLMEYFAIADHSISGLQNVRKAIKPFPVTVRIPKRCKAKRGPHMKEIRDKVVASVADESLDGYGDDSEERIMDFLYICYSYQGIFSHSITNVIFNVRFFQQISYFYHKMILRGPCFVKSSYFHAFDILRYRCPILCTTVL